MVGNALFISAHPWRDNCCAYGGLINEYKKVYIYHFTFIYLNIYYGISQQRLFLQ